jgi:hypothetical protein
MRPPICEVCQGHAVDTVSFGNFQPLPDGMEGHPGGLGWFCDEHLSGATTLTDLPMGEAISRIRSGDVPGPNSPRLP